MSVPPHRRLEACALRNGRAVAGTGLVHRRGVAGRVLVHGRRVVRPDLVDERRVEISGLRHRGGVPQSIDRAGLIDLAGVVGTGLECGGRAVEAVLRDLGGVQQAALRDACEIFRPVASGAILGDQRRRAIGIGELNDERLVVPGR